MYIVVLIKHINKTAKINAFNVNVNECTVD